MGSSRTSRNAGRALPYPVIAGSMLCGVMTLVGGWAVQAQTEPTTATATSTSTSNAPDISARREILAAMSVGEKRALLLKKERFDQLSNEEQQRIRELHEQLQRHPNQESLNQVLTGYVTWLATLPQKERAELADLDTTARLQQIRKLTRSRTGRRLAGVGLTTDDARSIYEWWRSTIESEQESLISRIKSATNEPDERAQREVRELLNDRRRFTSRIHGVIRLTNALGGLENVVGFVSHKGLLEQLSDDAIRQYLSKETPQAKNELVATWISTVLRPPPIPKEKLQALMSQLPKEMQDKLETLPPNQMFERLEQIYRERFWNRSGRDRRRGRGGRRGEGGDGREEGRRRGEGHDDEREGRREDGRREEGRRDDGRRDDGRRGRNERDRDQRGPDDGRRPGPPGEPPFRPRFDDGPFEGGPPPEAAPNSAAESAPGDSRPPRPE